jgi:hypothetical protein
MRNFSNLKTLVLGIAGVLHFGLVSAASAQTCTAPKATAPKPAPPMQSTALDRGFELLYNLDFAAAQRQFISYEQEHPDDPLGPTSEAAGVLFAELNQLGILDSAFFKDPSRAKPTTDPEAYKRFDTALQRAEAIAHKRLNTDAGDRDALLAVTLEAGLRADYTALILRKGAAALHYTKDATNSAQHLLAVCPDCYDAYVATGITRYLIGTKSAPVRWVLRFRGLSGNKELGIADLQTAAECGHYLAPFARIVLAIVYTREKDPVSAVQVLTQLHNDFPRNPLFAREIALERAAGVEPASPFGKKV